MLKNIKKLIDFLFISYVMLIIFGSNISFAGSTTEDVVIKCCVTEEEGVHHRIAGVPDTRITLTTRGIEVAGEKDLVVNWGLRSDEIYVRAKCLPSEGVGMNMFPEFEDEDEPPPAVLPSLVCKKGEGIQISFLGPNSPDPSKYQYIATLTREKDEKTEEKEAVKQKTPAAAANSSDISFDYHLATGEPADKPGSGQSSGFCGGCVLLKRLEIEPSFILPLEKRLDFPFKQPSFFGAFSSFISA